jgi:hypothetical protein
MKKKHLSDERVIQLRNSVNNPLYIKISINKISETMANLLTDRLENHEKTSRERLRLL